MKVLIAYDGSDCSQRALMDLRRAGMPEKAQAVVLSVADDWLGQGVVPDNIIMSPYTAILVPEPGSVELSLKEAAAAADKAARTLRDLYPHWEVRPESVADSAAWGVIEKIESWKPDLVVLGSHGRSGAGRLLFGSVSHKVLSHVHCNLRISRGKSEEEKKAPPLRIVVAYDGSQESETTFESVLCRHWPEGTAIRLITVIDSKVATAFVHPTGPIRFWMTDGDKNPLAWLDRMLSYQKDRIREKGFIAYSEAQRGDPKRVLLKEAEGWGADTIFVGPRGLTGRQRIIAGSVSTAIAMNAHCSVEVVHRLWEATACCQNASQEHRACMTREKSHG